MSRVTLRLPEDLHRRLRAVSGKQGISLNQLIVSSLAEAVDRMAAAECEEDERQAERRLVREALGDLLIELDVDEYLNELCPGTDIPSHEALRALMPRLDPPISATIIAERREQRYD